ncbi:MAG: hypothetical protein GWP91_22660, partial [Rhodobacterales bacterium]|nr:hypothetical protein [Rhodobacterales bacterium]
MNAQLVLTLLACHSPADAGAAAESFSKGDLQTALTHVPRSYSTRWTASQTERTALRSLEQSHLLDAAKRVLQAKELGRATTAISAGIRLDPQAFAGLEASLLAEIATQPDAAEAANTWVALSEAHHLDVSFHEQAQREARARLDQGLVQQRYLTDAQPHTLTTFAGVNAKMLPAALERIHTDYRVSPPWTRMSVAAANRLALVAAHPDVVSALPRSSELLRACEDAVPVADQASLAQQGAELLSIGVAAGMPEALLVAEWTEGAIGALDPWSSVVWPSGLTGWDIHHSGVEVGVGLTIDLFGDVVRVTLPDPAGPAWAAGLNQGDALVSIDGEALQNWPLQERLVRARAALRGEQEVKAVLVV